MIWINFCYLHRGKPKKGRGGPRDAKRSRQSSEPDFDYEDDADLM